MGFKCGFCGEWHDELPLDIAYKRPVIYFRATEHEIEEKVFETKYFTKVDDKEFAVRGLIYIPVHDYEDMFCWGVWAKVDRSTYNYIWDNWEKDTSGEIFNGVLDVEIPTYQNTYEQEVEIQLQGENEQPIFILKNKNTKLGYEQENGISVERVLEINHEVLG